MEVEGPGSPLTAAEAGEVIETQPAVSDEAASIVIFLIESRFPLLLGECFRAARKILAVKKSCIQMI